MDIDVDVVKQDFNTTVSRWLITTDKKNARDVYLAHLIKKYDNNEYGKVINILGLEYLTYADDMQLKIAELVMDVLSALLFVGGEFDEFHKLQTEKEYTSLGLLMRRAIKVIESQKSTIDEWIECFTDIEDSRLEEEGYTYA